MKFIKKGMGHGAHTSIFADGFRGKKRIKNARSHCFRYRTTILGDRNRTNYNP
ncbi:hypothetical protein [Nostoc sp.]|uniref:hypothetical protein n=1 Tax=Nostoc sp. TaxID=1180 RepID=UPI002FFADA10